MTEKVRKTDLNSVENEGEYCKVPERTVGHFCAAQNSGIVVDMEIQLGEPVDSQIIRNFMGEFRAANSKKSA